MLLSLDEILEDIISRNAGLDRDETKHLIESAIEKREVAIEIGDSLLIPDIHVVNENLLDLEKRIYLLGLEPLRQTSTRNYQLLFDSLKALGMRRLVPELLEFLLQINPLFSESFIYGDNWTELAVFFAICGKVEELTGNYNPRSFETYGMYSCSHEAVRVLDYYDERRRTSLRDRLDNFIVKMAQVQDVFGLAQRKNRVANYDFIFEHVTTEREKAEDGTTDFRTHYTSKYFENFRGEIRWEHEWWVNGIWRGLSARKRMKFAELEVKYYLDRLAHVLRDSFGYARLKIEATDSEEGVLLADGKEIAHDVILERKPIACSASFVTRMGSRPFPMQRMIYIPTPIAISSVPPDELASGLKDGRFIRVSHVDERLYDHKQGLIVKEGEMFGAPYSYTVLTYKNQKVESPDVEIFAEEKKHTPRTSRFYSRRAEEAALRASLRGRFVELQRTAESERHHRQIAEAALTESERRSRIFMTYTRRSLVDRVSMGEDPRELVSKRVDMAILFSDIRNFTGFAENIDPQDVVNFLNSYFRCMNAPIIAHSGEIDKLMGDCIMAGFYNPENQPQSANDAVNAAISIRRALQDFNRKRRQYYEEKSVGEFVRINNGIGITYGSVVMGNIGSMDKLDYTLIGDIVNTSDRLEKLTKEYEVDILITDEVFRELSERHHVRFVDYVRARGKDKPIAVMEVFDHEPPEIVALKERNNEEMQSVFQAYMGGDFEAALEKYRLLRERSGRHSLMPDRCADPLIDFYIKRCTELIRERDAKIVDMDKWDGVYNAEDRVPELPSIPFERIEEIVVRRENMQNRSLEITLKEQLGTVMRATNANAGTIYIADEEERDGQRKIVLKVGYIRNDGKEIKLEELARQMTSFEELIEDTPRTAKSIAGHVFRTREIRNISDVYQIGEHEEFRFDSSYDERTGYWTKSMLAVPIKDKRGKPIGVLQLINAMNRKNVVQFSNMDVLLTRFYAGEIADAITRLQEDREKVLGLGNMVADHDPAETGAHNNRVAGYADAIYLQWALNHMVPEDEMMAYKERLELGARCHDIGKICVPRELLKAERRLTEEEFKIIKSHALNTSRYISEIDAEWTKIAREVGMYHHERYNGTGYPFGKRGEDIPISARIVAVADVYDALVSTRHYKQGIPHEVVMQNIIEDSGRHFDPEVVKAFCQIESQIDIIRERYKDAEK